MRVVLFLSCMLMLLASGCAGFAGEWLEDSRSPDEARPARALSERRTALKFEVPSTVRYGPYVDSIGVVDAKAMQSDSYFLYDGWDKAEFGSFKAKVTGDHMVATGDGEYERHFTRVKGKSIFPPTITLPELP